MTEKLPPSLEALQRLPLVLRMQTLKSGRAGTPVYLPEVFIPGQVSNFTLGEATNKSIAYSFVAPNQGTPPIIYRVEYRLAAMSSWTVFSETTDTSGIVTGLSPSAPYAFRVTPYNIAAGVGPASAVLYKSTLAADFYAVFDGPDLVFDGDDRVYDGAFP